MTFRIADTQAFAGNPFEIMRGGVLVTVQAKGQINTMTVGWGGFGHFWGRDTVYMAIRPERHTFGMIQLADTFSVSVLPKTDSAKDILDFCGSVSGRDRDKIEACGLTVAFMEDTPYFQEAETVFICEKLANPHMTGDWILPGHGIREQWYGGGFHHLFVGGILQLLVRDDPGRPPAL